MVGFDEVYTAYLQLRSEKFLKIMVVDSIGAQGARNHKLKGVNQEITKESIWDKYHVDRRLNSIMICI